MSIQTEERKRVKPDWLKIKIPSGQEYLAVKQVVESNNLHTICQSGKCPNMGECWGAGTATFMILGDICTRACQFCAVKTGRPMAVDLNEPQKVAEAVQLMALKHCVITSVDRDDLPDGGASVWAATIKAVKNLNPETTIEVLIPDFKGKKELIAQIIEQKPNVISHNIETVRRLTKLVRRNSDYDRSLAVLQQVAVSGLRAKSGIMLGLGELEQEVIQSMDDLRAASVEVMTIGQYLQPTKELMEVKEFITPGAFKKYERIGLEKGFKYIESGALVRSSYHAEKHVH